MTMGSWQLTSISGREAARWDVQERHETARRGVALSCNVQLEGQYFGAALGESSKVRDYRLLLKGLEVGTMELKRLSSYLGEWLKLPLAEQAGHPLTFVCNVGELFDQSLTMKLGKRDDTLADGNPIVTLGFIVGRLKGELSLVTDQKGLELFCAGIDAVLHEAG
jgi:hypothetical protein